MVQKMVHEEKEKEENAKLKEKQEQEKEKENYLLAWTFSASSLAAAPFASYVRMYVLCV